MPRKKSKSDLVTRVMRAGEAFFRTPEAENHQLRRLAAENLVLTNNNAALANKAAQLVHLLEHEQSKKTHDDDIVNQLRKDLAWEKQHRLALEEQLKEFKQTAEN
jgi:hypothetical protein